MNQITLPAHTALVAHDTVGPDALREFFDHYYPCLLYTSDAADE